MTDYPVLLGLSGRAVVVVGGGPVAARRVRGLLEADAEVRVVAPQVCEDLADLVEEGTVRWVPREYAGGQDLAGAWLVHTATGDRHTDAAVAADAERARVFCVHAGGTGDAQVPAVASVDTPDGPVTIAVNGHRDPRRAAAVRDAVAGGLQDGRLPIRRRRTRTGDGWVALVGSGPGPTGMLTSRGRALVAAADVLVIDRLGARGVLDELPEQVEVIDVGKTPGHHPWPQHEINAELVRHALAGRAVVRLKGGDPFVFGRGGEEAQACREAGVAVEVVPGVSSAVAVPAAAGIPVTHRGLSRGFTVVTGHDEIATLPTSRDHTLIVLMGVTRLASICAALLAQGRAPTTPAAIIEDGYGPNQRVTTATLDVLARRAEQAGVRPPAVVVVGDVVTLSPHWAEST